MTINIENVWRTTIPLLREEIIAFWEKHKMLPPGVSATERVAEVVLVARDPSTRDIVGISSAGHIRFKQLNDNYFFAYRSIVLPSHRVPGLPQKMIVETRNTLEAYASSMKEHRCIGMVTFVESKTVIQSLSYAVWPASQMVFIGNDAKGRQIRVYYFKGATI